MSLEFSSVNGSPCPSDAVLDDGKPFGRIYERHAPGIVSSGAGLGTSLASEIGDSSAPMLRHQLNILVAIPILSGLHHHYVQI
jgi:hypothetical protein